MRGLASPKILSAALADAIRPRVRLTVSAWADVHRVLTSKGSSEPGQWQTSRVPFAREPMDSLSASSPVRRVVLKFATQMTKTEIGLNWIGYVMSHAPAPMLVVVPTLEVRRRWVRQRLDPLLSETPAIRALFDSRRARDASNAEDMKDFPGGLLVIGGANSAASLASMPMCNVLCDEVDRFPWEVGQEGDPLGLIDERTKNFPRRKVCLVSSPTLKGASRIDEEFERSDQRYYHVPCVHCGAYWAITWQHLRWDGALTRAWLVCHECGAEIEEHHKTALLEQGRWIPVHPGRPVRGYTINALYAPVGLGWNWLELARNWIDCQGDKAKLKRFINTSLAEAWEDLSRKKADPQELATRADDIEMRSVPPGCLLLTAGVDTQDDRLELHIIGHGPDRRWWVIDYLVLPGNPGRDEVWLELAAVLNTPLRNAYGRDLHVKACAIDMGGHHSEDVKAFTLARRTPRCKLLAVQGSRYRLSVLLNANPKKTDFNWRGKSVRHGAEVWQVGTEVGKDKIYNDISGDSDLPAHERRVRFPSGLPATYYEQLMSEVYDPEKNRYTLVRGRRNEALDTCVYAHAASQHPTLRVDRLRPADWERLRLVLEPGATADPFTVGADVAVGAADALEASASNTANNTANNSTNNAAKAATNKPAADPDASLQDLLQQRRKTRGGQR